MSDPLVIQTLTAKRAEILGQIKAYEAQIAHAKYDLAHLNATMELFAGPERQRARYLVSHGFFKKGEIADICAQHLAADGEMTTRELAERVMAARDLEVSDTALRNSVVFKVVQALRHAKRRKLVRMVEKRKGMCVWGAGDAVTARASLPIALPRPADWGCECAADHAVRQATIALVPMIFEPSRVRGVSIQISPIDLQVLSANHPSKAREEAFCEIGMNPIKAVGVRVVDPVHLEGGVQQILVRAFIGGD